MTEFSEIREAAVARIGQAELKRRLPKVKSAKTLKATEDAAYFSAMSFLVFATGLNRRVVEGKWPAFRQVFHDFIPARVRAIPPETLEALTGDARIIRHWGKIKATQANGAAMCDIADEFGGFGNYIAAWPGADIVGLWDDIAKRFSFMGGRSAAYFLRRSGKDTFMPSPDMIKALRHFDLYDGTGKGKKELRRLNQAVHELARANRKSMAHVSMTLAASVD